MAPRYSVVFHIHNPGPPWTCFRCGRLILRRGKAGDDLNIHHLDGDHTNNDPANLAPAHKRCHTAHHMEVRTPEEQARINAQYVETYRAHARLLQLAQSRHNMDPGDPDS